MPAGNTRTSPAETKTTVPPELSLLPRPRTNEDVPRNIPKVMIYELAGNN